MQVLGIKMAGGAQLPLDNTARVAPLSNRPAGWRGVVHAVASDQCERVDRLLALGVTPGAPITVLQTFPGIVFLCDQTELAVERSVADTILVKAAEE